MTTTELYWSRPDLRQRYYLVGERLYSAPQDLEPTRGELGSGVIAVGVLFAAVALVAIMDGGRVRKAA